MNFFITTLRALAACLITNSHYTGIYPTDLIANGGLIGDIIFFAVSGYCLYNPKYSFFQWYGKRLNRIYVPVLVGTVVYLLLGCYSFDSNPWFWWLVYPTNYHFVASIIVLYIPYYFVVTTDWCKNHLDKIMVTVAFCAIVIYVFFYDTSYYHIDKVREPYIRFLFFESMLLGALFKQKGENKNCDEKISYIHYLAFSGCFIAYFASKLLFAKVDEISEFQILNQVIIFTLLYFVFLIFSEAEENLNRLPNILKRTIQFIANITLEIYIVQYVLIDVLRPLLGFPMNWIAITGSIIVSAYALHIASKGIYAITEKTLKKFKPE